MLAVGTGTRADLIYAARINSTQLSRYLGFLVDNRLLEERKTARNKKVYHLTAEGEKALWKLREIIQMLGVDERVDARSYAEARLERLARV
jgi:predicted transcriptional regulator